MLLFGRFLLAWAVRKRPSLAFPAAGFVRLVTLVGSHDTVPWARPGSQHTRDVEDVRQADRKADAQDAHGQEASAP